MNFNQKISINKDKKNQFLVCCNNFLVGFYKKKKNIIWKNNNDIWYISEIEEKSTLELFGLRRKTVEEDNNDNDDKLPVYIILSI
jgi:hypothetical protein